LVFFSVLDLGFLDLLVFLDFRGIDNMTNIIIKDKYISYHLLF
jgi:hypothetical protein